MESRIEDLEIRSAHQERAIEELSEQVRAQHRAIEALQRQLRHLHSRLEAMRPSDVAPMSEETPPPHYRAQRASG